MALILIVDDSPLFAKAHEKLLSRYGHRILFAGDGEEGIEMARQHKPDLILMDVVMPKVNGFQATRKLSRNPDTAHIPIIITSTKNMNFDIAWGKRQGATDYLIKPVDGPDLIDTVHRVLLG